MANSILTPTAVTREAARILHQKLNFVGSINRQYDSSFAQSGAKIGDSLKIRMPNQYTVRTGATLSTQDVTESSETLQVATQKGVDVTFTTAELTMSLDDFSSRIIEPAMSVLAANIEADAYSMYKDVYNMVDGDAATIAFSHLMNGRKVLNDNLTPIDSYRSAMLGTTHAYKLVDALKGLFQDSSAITKQYKEGKMGRTGGFDFYESTFASDHTTGTSAKATGYTVNGAGQIGSTVTVQVGANTFNKGDVITFAGCYQVHPETKAAYSNLQQFVVTANYAGGAGNISISPAIVTSGAKQNVSASPTNGGAVVKVGAGASETLNTSMVYHKDAFVFATADLEDVSQYGAWGAREVFDGISIRIARQYAISSDTVPCRIDVLYGYKTIRPQLACRIHADG